MISFNDLGSVGANETQKSLNIPSTSTGTAPSKSGETALPLVNSQRKLELIKLAKRFCISVEQLESIVNNDSTFLSKDFEEQQKIVQAKFEAQPEVVETKPESGSERPLLSALAQNIFVSGVKDENGNYIQGLEPHSIEDWDALGAEQKQTFITNIETMLNQDEMFVKFGNKVKEQLRQVDNSEQVSEGFTKLTLLQMKASTTAGINYQEFLLKSESEKIGLIENYLSSVDKNQLSDFEKEYLNSLSQLKTGIRTYVSKEFGVEIPENIDAGQINEYLENLNITSDEVVYELLKSKQEREGTLSQLEEQTFKTLDLKINSEAGKVLLMRQKSANLKNLQIKLDDLQQKLNNGEILSAEEQQQYDILKQTLSSEEAKTLENVELPTAQDDYQRQIMNEVEQFEQRVECLHDTKMKTALAIEDIEQKTKDMTPEQKKEYIANYINFASKHGYSMELLSYYNKKGIDLSNNFNLLLEYSVIYNECSLEQQENVNSNLDVASLSAPSTATAAYKTASAVMESVDGGDDVKTKLISTGITVAENTKDSSVLISSTSLNMNIKDADLQLQNRNNIAASDVYNNDVAKFELDNLNRYHTQNRLPILDNVTEGNAEMTAYAAENGAVTKLAVKDQVEGFNLLNDRVNEFIDQGVLTTDSLKNLADQIADCDRTNQLAMHEKIMDSKYTEVQEHAAGNIKNYDPSVQADAIDTVFSTGNAKAIETALNDIASGDYTNGVQGVVLRLILEKAINSGDDELIELIKDKINSGLSLTLDEYRALSPKEKSDYKVAYFKSLSPAKQIAILSHISDPSLKKSIYKKIASTDKALLKNIIESDVNTAKFIYDMSIANDLVIQVAEHKASSQIGYAELLRDIKRDLEESSKAAQDAEPKTAKTLSYTTLPKGFDEFVDEKFYPFKKDRDGYILT